MLLEIPLEGFEIVGVKPGAHAVDHAEHHVLDTCGIFVRIFFGVLVFRRQTGAHAHHAVHGFGEIAGLRGYCDRIV